MPASVNNPQAKQPIKLLRNISYPTFQLYAEIDKTVLNPEIALKVAVAETFSWLRTRFRDFDAFDDISFPEPLDYSSIDDNALRSFRIREGYVIDVVYVKDDGIWAFNLIEPDLGPDPGNPDQHRRPVPGRVYETNIAFRVTENALECGFKVICSEPVGTAAPCEVFRVSVFKNMVRNPLLKLRHIVTLQETAHIPNNAGKIKDLRDLIKNKDRQIPVVILSEYAQTTDKTALMNQMADSLNAVTPYQGLLPVALPESTAQESAPLFDTELLIKYGMGFAHFFRLPSRLLDEYNRRVDTAHRMESGDVRILFPLDGEDKDSRVIPKHTVASDPDGAKETILRTISEYPKKRAVCFGNVKFINEAKLAEQKKILAMNTDIAQTVAAYEKSIGALKKTHEHDLAGLRAQLEQRGQKIQALKAENEKLEEEKRQASDTAEAYKAQADLVAQRLQTEIEKRPLLTRRPHKAADFADWVGTYFADRLILHDKAVALMKKPQPELDMGLLCDAIEYLATEYRDTLTGTLTEEDCRTQCTIKYGRPFDVCPTGDRNIAAFPEDYKIKYGTSRKGKLAQAPLNLHLRVGVDSRWLLRIYFLYDNEKKLIVIGSLPAHLRTMSES